MPDNIIKDYMKKRIFKLDDKGVLLFDSIRDATVPAESMAIFLQETGIKLGSDYLYKLGVDVATNTAIVNTISMRLDLIPMALRMRMLNVLLEVIGYGKCDIKIYDIKNNKALIHYSYNPVIEAAKRLYGRESLVCNFYMGIFAAHGMQVLGFRDAHLIETQCVCRGDQYCEWNHNVFTGEKNE